jgi:hypothetical protein
MSNDYEKWSIIKTDSFHQWRAATQVYTLFANQIKINSLLNTFLFQDENKSGFEFLRVTVILMKVVDKALFLFVNCTTLLFCLFFFLFFLESFFSHTSASLK